MTSDVTLGEKVSVALLGSTGLGILEIIWAICGVELDFLPPLPPSSLFTVSGHLGGKFQGGKRHAKEPMPSTIIKLRRAANVPIEEISIHNQLQSFLYRVSLFWHCHQRPKRSFAIKGRQLPLCARCIGLLFGPLVFPAYFLLKDWRVCLALILLFFADSITQVLGFRESNNYLRVVTGAAFSLAMLSLSWEGIKICLQSIRP